MQAASIVTVQHSFVSFSVFPETFCRTQFGAQAGTLLAIAAAKLHVPILPSEEAGFNVPHPTGHFPFSLAKKKGLSKTLPSHWQTVSFLQTTAVFSLFVQKLSAGLLDTSPNLLNRYKTIIVRIIKIVTIINTIGIFKICGLSLILLLFAIFDEFFARHIRNKSFWNFD